MRQKIRNEQGFTLIELVLVITVLGILAVAALPQFIDVSTDAELASRDGIVGAVRSGIALQRANDLVQNGPPGNPPATLDGAAASTTASSTNVFFDNVLQAGLADGSWTKGGTVHVYVFSDGTNNHTYTYTPATGAFTGP